MDTNSPPSSSSSHQWKYHVFLSFRGEDTRKSFTDHLYAALKQKGIFTFRDDEELERGRPISLELLKAIEESLFAIIIFSKNYASSTWCLDELTETYAQAFVEHEKQLKENIEKVHTWRVALREVTNLSGWSLQDRPESEFIQDIVEVILHKLSYAFPRDTKGFVGIDSRVEELMSLLAIGSNDVRIIGVWGMGGIGKTTLARVVYWMLVNEFQGGSFITNIREVSEKYGLLPTQQKLICEILMERSINIRDVDDGVLMIRNRFNHKRILLVLDDVNQFNQLEKLAGEPNWFGPGSRVIITTRDRHLLIRHKVYGIYEVKGLNDDEALHLLSLKAFNNNHPPKDYLKLSKQFVSYAKGLPLAIEGTKAIQGLVLDLPMVPGSSELKKSKEAHWNPEAFSKMANLKLLIIYGVHLLHGPKHLPNGLRFLDWSEYPLKSLPLSFQPDELVELHMWHSKIERLWKGTKYLDKLKFIKLNNSLNLIATPDFTGVPNLEELVVKGCINLRKVHPSIVVHKRLILLNLEGCKNLSNLPSKFEMESLEILILSGCSKIKRIPEFMENMERLSKLHLDGTAITKLPSSVERLTNLASLHLRDCKNLVCLPSIICSFKSLKDLKSEWMLET
uniref:TIR domain-containing protein n=1 Tax=Fagus sylvatica TaxID=28930 RepID=A0A2N9H5H0_FAGSY